MNDLVLSAVVRRKAPWIPLTVLLGLGKILDIRFNQNRVEKKGRPLFQTQNIRGTADGRARRGAPLTRHRSRTSGRAAVAASPPTT
eukprot:scaffold988_cov105-Isochrysis_galbana.AAC.12